MPRLSLAKCSLLVLAVGLSLTSAEKCQVGYYSSTGLEPCIITPPGYVASAPGQHPSPSPCAAGFYQPKAGQGSCLKAPAGYIVSGTAATSAVPCPPGTAQPNNEATECIPCGYGQYSSNEAAHHCKACPAGTIPAKSATACAPVIPGGPDIISLPGPSFDFFGLALDGAGIPWAWGTSFLFASTDSSSSDPGVVPIPAPLSDITLRSGTDYISVVPTTPAGASIVAVSAGVSCGVLLYSDTTAGFVGDVSNSNQVSNFVNSDGFITDSSGNVLTGIRRVVAPGGDSFEVGLSPRGFLLLRGNEGYVTYLLDGFASASSTVVDVNNNVIDPLQPTVPLKGAIQVAQGLALACALMGPRYEKPNTVVCFARDFDASLGATPLSFLGAKLTLDVKKYPLGPSLISVDGVSYIRATSISVGGFHACATVGSRSVPCWGIPDSDYGEILAGAPVDGITVTPAVVYNAALTTFPSSDVLSIQAVSCGYFHTCIVLTDSTNGAGVVRCWGVDGTLKGEFGSSRYPLNQDVLYEEGPLKGKALTGVTSITAGVAATCVTLGTEESVACA